MTALPTAPVDAVSRPPDARPLRRFLGHRSAIRGLVLLTVIAAACLSAPLIKAALGVDTGGIDLDRRFAPPDAVNWLGRDELGRDLFVRLLEGGRISLAIAVLSAAIATAIGTMLGLLAGLAGGRIDQMLMRMTDTVIAVPVLPLLIILAALDPAKLPLPAAVTGAETFGLYRIAVIVALFGWTTVARLVRSATRSVRARDHVRAAVALGAGPVRIALVHILPHILSPVLVATALTVGQIILMESVLSFLGLGVPAPLPSWGGMLSNAQEFVWTDPMLAVWPGLMIFLTVIAFNLVGDGLQDALDPRSEERRS